MCLQLDAKRIASEHLSNSHLCSPCWGIILAGFPGPGNGDYVIGWCSGRFAEAGLQGTSSGSRLLSGVVEGYVA